MTFADVTSANTVGYLSSELVSSSTGGARTMFNMIALPFCNVDGSNIDLNDGSIKFEGVIEGQSFDDVDLIEVYDPENGYTYHYFFEGDGWTDDSGNGYFADDYPDGLPAGSAMWLEAFVDDANRPGTLKFTYAGAVESDADDITLVVSSDIARTMFNMVANPYPVAWDPNDESKVKFSGVIKGQSFDDVDLLEVYDPENGYTYHYYFEGDGWTDDSGNGYFEEDYPDGIQPGTAVWFEAFCDDSARSEETKVKFINPLAD